MKQLWSILLEKVKQVEPNMASLGIGVMGLFAMGMVTRVIVAFFKMIVDIILAIKGQPMG